MREKDREDPERSIPSPNAGAARNGGAPVGEREVAAGDRVPFGEEEATEEVALPGADEEAAAGGPSAGGGASARSEETPAPGDPSRESAESSETGEAREGVETVVSADVPELRLRRRRRRRNILLGLLVAILATMLTCTAYEFVTWPDVRALAESNPETTAFIERYKERQLDAGHDPKVSWRWVPYDRISPHLKRAVVVGEDIEFFSHEGFSFSEIKATLDRFLRGEAGLRGASTITQQLAKNLWLSPSRNPLRKLKEALLTRQLEKQLSKRRILEIYLNVVEFGRGIYGAEAASRRYLGKSANNLSELEAAQLAAALPRSDWHPVIDSSRYRWYVNEILGRMAEADFLWRRIGADIALPPPEKEDTAAADSALLDSLPFITIPAETVTTDTGIAPALPPDTMAGDMPPRSVGGEAGSVDFEFRGSQVENEDVRVKLLRQSALPRVLGSPHHLAHQNRELHPILQITDRHPSPPSPSNSRIHDPRFSLHVTSVCGVP